jgi:hypothetical protein
MSNEQTGKQTILEAFDQDKDHDHRKNIMGADDAWYDTDYAITQVFTKDQVQAMSDDEIGHITALGDKMAEMLY